MADIDFRRTERVLLNDFAFVEKNHERLLIAFGAAMNQTHIGNKVCGFRVHSGEFIFPYFITAIGKGGLRGIAIELAHMLLTSFSFDQLPGHSFRRSVRDAFIADASAPAQEC